MERLRSSSAVRGLVRLSLAGTRIGFREATAREVPIDSSVLQFGPLIICNRNRLTEAWISEGFIKVVRDYEVRRCPPLTRHKLQYDDDVLRFEHERSIAVFNSRFKISE